MPTKAILFCIIPAIMLSSCTSKELKPKSPITKKDSFPKKTSVEDRRKEIEEIMASLYKEHNGFECDLEVLASSRQITKIFYREFSPTSPKPENAGILTHRFYTKTQSENQADFGFSIGDYSLSYQVIYDTEEDHLFTGSSSATRLPSAPKLTDDKFLSFSANYKFDVKVNEFSIILSELALTETLETHATEIGTAKITNCVEATFKSVL